MAFVIGFGSTEEKFERDEEQAIREFVDDLYHKERPDYFNDGFVKVVREWLNDRAQVLHAQAGKYKTAEQFPDRYSRYWPTVIADASHIVFLLSMHHINRRHAMSPDGWALMQTEPMFVIKNFDLDDQYRCAEAVA